MLSMKEQMKKNKKVYIGIIGGILLILFFMMPIFYVQSVSVNNNHYYKTEEIVEIAGLKSKHFLDFNYFTAENKIKSLPYIASAKVSYKFPGKIMIEVAEKAPFAYVEFKGTYLCINERGQVIEQTQQKYHSIPVIDGLDFESFINGETLPITNQDTWLIAKEIVDGLGEYEYTAKVSEVDVHNIEEIHLYVDKLDVIMGDIGDFDKKIETLIAVHDENGYTMGRLNLSVVNTKLNAAYLEPIL